MHRPLALAKYIAGYPARFDWPTANCCHWASGWVHRIEGVDPMAGLPLTPDAQAAMRLVAQLGGSILAVWRDHLLKREPISPTLAQIGDVVLHPTHGPCRWAVGICAGRTFMLMTETGAVAHLPMTEASHAWRIGAASC